MPPLTVREELEARLYHLADDIESARENGDGDFCTVVPGLVAENSDFFCARLRKCGIKSELKHIAFDFWSFDAAWGNAA